MRYAPFPFKSALECTFSTFPLRQPFHQLNATLPPKLAILLEPVKPTYYRRIKNTSLTEDQAKFTLYKNYPIIIQLPRPSFLEVKYLNLAIWNTVVLNEMLTQWHFFFNSCQSLFNFKSSPMRPDSPCVYLSHQSLLRVCTHDFCVNKNSVCTDFIKCVPNDVFVIQTADQLYLSYDRLV